VEAGVRTRAVQTRSRRGEILAAALRLFNERGYARTGIQDVVREAGASIGSVYHHFDGKEDIAAALYVEGMADYQGGLLEELETEHESAEEAVKAIVLHHLHWVKRHRSLAHYLLTSRDPELLSATSGTLKDMNRELFDAVRDWMERWELPRMPIGLLHAIVLGPSQEFSRHWIAGRTKQSIDAAAPVLAEAAWKAVRA
jgi:AcrR family transcriptional regulator